MVKKISGRNNTTLSKHIQNNIKFTSKNIGENFAQKSLFGHLDKRY